MLEIVVEEENRRRHIRPSAEELAGLVRRIGGKGDQFLVVQQIPDLPDVYIQVWHETGGDYTLEHRAGSADRHFQTSPDDPETVIAAITGWAHHRPGWDGGGLSWSPLDLGPEPKVPPLTLADDDREALEDRVREALDGGYATRAELAELAEEYLVTGRRRPVSPEQARALADRLWLERVAEQVTWQGETDPERLTRAFTALRAAGITARENFTCCRSCGQSEIRDAGEPDARGYVYFHSQCTDSAAAGQGLMLLYGGFDNSPDTTAAIGHEIVTALEAAGLRTDWNGDTHEAITVTPLDWRRRLIG
ncbi:hypothetical protein BN159_4999 [Streptomyces davaonensis JCM 4913]|uniref:DUF6891 domain-containing protein n=1 Tax=Streptomyces davaonensis (strain DSM 101723 / JCM 4913 / KCC S-0913 / 768) TaxID=1214101 RepID=K4R7R5_STRDJ|nr:hypothetical protein [Streptomyces davaonensis]CCK29378.1 hypothetical protein BN159_4999 [Streptomyces davaonensis JCM 4913]